MYIYIYMHKRSARRRCLVSVRVPRSGANNAACYDNSDDAQTTTTSTTCFNGFHYRLSLSLSLARSRPSGAIIERRQRPKRLYTLQECPRRRARSSFAREYIYRKCVRMTMKSSCIRADTSACYAQVYVNARKERGYFITYIC